MIRQEKNISLKPFNTFHIEAKADSFFEFSEEAELLQAIHEHKISERHFTLGGGSNLLFAGDFKGSIIRPNIQGIKVIEQTSDSVFVEAGAGVEWDSLVDFAVENNWGGLENLSLIPGKVGASPVQNIGAYGEEACNRIFKVRGIELKTGNIVEFTNEQCHFNYRSSIFKKELLGQIIVVSVVYKLDRKPSFNLRYGLLKSEAEKLGPLSVQTVRQTVIAIRKAKLPDPNEIGSAGSFFVNPLVSDQKADTLLSLHPDMPRYTTANEHEIKLAAGWLIEKTGWKGYRKGDAGVHANQALVLVNYGNATGKEILTLAHDIQNSVFDTFGVELNCEVNIIGQ